MLITSSSNAPAVGLYRKTGFEQVNVRQAVIFGANYQFSGMAQSRG
jgi:ribosomal protein S18 acetylase RimI-like enzyme